MTPGFRCPSCGAHDPRSCNFCPKCGAIPPGRLRMPEKPKVKERPDGSYDVTYSFVFDRSWSNPP